MPYPMIPGNIYERWYKSVEEKIGLPADISGDLLPRHLSFYLQNKKEIKVEEYNNEILFTILNDNLGKKIYKKIYDFEPIGSDIGHFFFGENDLEVYLNKIGFEQKFSGDNAGICLSSKEINRDTDKI